MIAFIATGSNKVIKNINDSLTVTFEVINLTDEEERIYGTGQFGTQDLTREYRHTGTQLFFGARYTL